MGLLYCLHCISIPFVFFGSAYEWMGLFDWKHGTKHYLSDLARTLVRGCFLVIRLG
jgi:hypothetical protein